jgi:hypothetical protein
MTPVDGVIWYGAVVVAMIMLKALRARWVGQDWRHNLFDAVLAATVIGVGTIAVSYFMGWLGADRKSARIRVVGVEVVDAVAVGQALRTPTPWPVINIHYQNAGDTVALGLTLRTVAGIFGGVPSAEKFLEIQGNLRSSTAWESDLKRREQEQTYPDEPKFVSIPNEPGAFARDFGANFQAIKNGTSSVLVVLEWKYKDESSGDRYRVTEKCFWMSGGNFAQHDCGRNRTFLE